MLPREHGAYGQLLFPLATALAIGQLWPGGWLLAAAAVFAFLAHEPMLVLLGQRGARAWREQRDRAVRWFAAWSTAAAACAAAAVMVMPPGARTALLGPLALGVVLGAVILARREHTTAGEILSAVTMASLALPVGLAGGALMESALTCALAFGAGFVAATACVRAVILRTRKPPAAGARLVGGAVAAAVIAALAVLASRDVIDPSAPWAAAPLCVGGLALAAVAPSARRLKTVGWTLVATTALTAAVLIAALA